MGQSRSVYRCSHSFKLLALCFCNGDSQSLAFRCLLGITAEDETGETNVDDLGADDRRMDRAFVELRQLDRRGDFRNSCLEYLEHRRCSRRVRLCHRVSINHSLLDEHGKQLEHGSYPRQGNRADNRRSVLERSTSDLFSQPDADDQHASGSNKLGNADCGSDSLQHADLKVMERRTLPDAVTRRTVSGIPSTDQSVCTRSGTKKILSRNSKLMMRPIENSQAESYLLR